jgi:SAM-dependent MidA family methyltransferase
MSKLPQPSAQEQAHSQQLQQLIIQKIHQAGGNIEFNEFMQLALYAPHWGYYTSARLKFGLAGDFTTAPELSPLFAMAMAQQCQQILCLPEHDSILEFGAGSGILAARLLLNLQKMACLPQKYYILELSADLRALQYATIKQYGEDLLTRVEWLQAWPENKIKGLIIANEVLDAMPVKLFQVHINGIDELCVAVDNEQFIWQTKPCYELELHKLVAKYKLEPGYQFEYQPQALAWLQSAADYLAEGVILILDYGFLDKEFYHPDRSSGTLMCHYKHYAHTNPLIYVGLQDITVHINFSALDISGLKIAGYSSQAQFLLNCGILEQLSQFMDNEREYFNLCQQAKILLMPQEMGEIFKVMALASPNTPALLGFGK